jgi:hypothetical protein
MWIKIALWVLGISAGVVLIYLAVLGYVFFSLFMQAAKFIDQVTPGEFKKGKGQS